MADLEGDTPEELDTPAETAPEGAIEAPELETKDTSDSDSVAGTVPTANNDGFEPVDPQIEEARADTGANSYADALSKAWA